MSGRLQRKSVRSSQRSRHSVMVTGDDALSYALRTAYLHYLLQPRPRRQVPAPAPQHVNRISTGSFQDLVADFSRTHRDPKSIRFPKGFLPVLKERTQLVLMGQDRQVEYKDAAVKRTFGSFYGALVEPRYYENTAKSRRPEDLLLIFYTHATKELQKLKHDDSWKQLVDRHVALFVRLMNIIIKEQGWASSNPELTARLSTLEKKLLRHDENLTEDSGGGRGSSSGMVLGPPEPLSYNINDMPMVKTVSRVFNVPLDVLQQDINKNKSVWTEKAAFQDMKAYMNNLNMNTGNTLRSNDFDLDDAYDAWCKAEKSEVSELILVMGRAHQELLTGSASAPRGRLNHTHTASTYDSIHRAQSDLHRTSMYESPSLYNGQSLDQMGTTMEDEDTPYVYIPPDPRIFYRHVVSRCLTADYNDSEIELEPIDIPGSDDPVLLLSKSSFELLEQCSLRWRVPKFSRMVLFLDALRMKYQEGEVDLSTLDAAFMFFDKMVESNWVAWSLADQNTYRQLLSSVHDFILRELYDILQHAYDKKAKPIGQVMWVLDQHIYNNELFTRGNMDDYVQQMKEGLKKRAEQVLEEMYEEEILRNSKTLDPLNVVNLVQNVIKLAEKVSKRFREPVLG
jgi:hypothetical protein